jgi:hypothetical protein
VAEARGAIGHQALALRRADGGAEIGLATEAAFTLAAFGRVERDHMIARSDGCYARADFANDTGTLMAEDWREDSFAVEAVKRVAVGVTDAGRLYLDKDFTGLRPVKIKLDDFKGFFLLRMRQRHVSSSVFTFSNAPIDQGWL